MNNSKRSRLGQAFVNAFSMAEYGKLNETVHDAMAAGDLPEALEADRLREMYEDLLQRTVAPGQA